MGRIIGSVDDKLSSELSMKANFLRQTCWVFTLYYPYGMSGMNCLLTTGVSKVMSFTLWKNLKIYLLKSY